MGSIKASINRIWRILKIILDSEAIYIDIGGRGYIPLIALVSIEWHSLGLGVSVSPLVALVSVELHS